MPKQIGQRVKIISGMDEFKGRTGEIIDNTDRDGSTVLYRVRLDAPVTVPGLGPVTDDLWQASDLRNVR